MSAAVAEIVVTLDAQVRLYQRLLDLSNAQLAALKVQDVQSVHAILQEIEIAMMERSRVEQRRGAAMQQAADELGIDIEEVTAARLQEVADAPIAEAIAASSAELKDLIGRLDVVVDKNRVLLEHELAVIDGMVKGMTAPRGRVTSMYGKTGAQENGPRLKILDAQV